MNTNTLTVGASTQNKRREMIFAVAILALCACAFVATPFALAQADAIAAVVSVICKICMVVGAIFTLVGIVKVAIAHANEDGPGTQKAAMMIASGIVLLILGATIIPNLHIENWIG